MAYGDGVMEAIRGTVLDGRPRIGGVSDGEAARRERRRLALSAAADYARSGRGGQGDADMHLERAAEEALSQAMFAGIMTYGKSAFALGRRTLADQLARRRASAATVLRRSRYQEGPFGEGVETLSDATLNPSTLTGARPAGRLGEVATVSEEYSRAYPGMERDVVVNVVPDSAWDGYVEAAKRARAEWAKTSDTSRGFFDRRLSAVSIRAQMPGETMEAYFDRADRTLVHELQHYAQMRDGLPATSPGSGYEWYRTAAREVEARNSANRLALTPQERLEMPRANTQDVKPKDVHLDDKGGKSGGFRGWKAYRDAKEAAEAEAAAVAVVNAGITNAPPLSAADLADSRASAEWLKSHERKGLVAEGTLPHTGRPRFYSGNGFMEGDTSFQGDRFSSIVPVDFDAYRGDAEAYKKTGRWAVIPTVYPDADGVTRLHTADAAESEYRKSGSHFGIFEGLENADSGAQWDHHKGNAEWAERETRQAAKGGDNFGTFRNFLATDDVPESIFGFPVVQDKSQYTEKDLEFFRKNPKAAGFYDLGDEEDVESQEDWGGADTLDDVREMTARWARESDGKPRLRAPSKTSVPVMTWEQYRELMSGRGGQGDSDLWLSRAAETALESAAFEGLLASSASLAARGLGVLRPVFVRGGRGLRASVEGINDGVYVGADAALRAGAPEDIESLRQFFSATDKTPFAKMDPVAREALVRRTGWQQLPTGEVVKQIPKFEFNPKVWRKLEQFATRTRRRLSELGWDDIETALGHKSVDGTVRGAYFEDVLSGPGAEQYFKYYPDARNYVLRVERRPDPKLMGEALGDEVVVTDAAFRRGVKQVVDTLHHEPQHLIQGDSGLTQGGNLGAASNVLRALNGAVDTEGAAFVRLPLSPGVTEAEKTAFRSNTKRMFDALMESEKLVEPGQGAGALEKLANADRSAADFFMYRHLGGEAGAHAVGHTASSAEPTPVIRDAMREIGINPDLVYDFSPASQVAKRAVRTTEHIRDRVMGVHQAAKGGKTAEGASQRIAGPRTTRGAYPGSLNNPGNVEKRKERRQGEVDSPSERFAKFATPQDGLREMADAIRQIAEVKLAEKGLPFTVRNFAGVYAPGTENDTAKYVADISADSGFGPDEELHRFDEGDMARLLKSVVRFESGAPHSAWFTDEEYAEAAKKLQEGAVD